MKKKPLATVTVRESPFQYDASKYYSKRFEKRKALSI